MTGEITAFILLALAALLVARQRDLTAIVILPLIGLLAAVPTKEQKNLREQVASLETEFSAGKTQWQDILREKEGQYAALAQVKDAELAELRGQVQVEQAGRKQVEQQLQLVKSEQAAALTAQQAAIAERDGEVAGLTTRVEQADTRARENAERLAELDTKIRKASILVRRQKEFILAQQKRIKDLKATAPAAVPPPPSSP